MGQRSKRYSIYVKNKIIEKMFVDADGKFDVSDSNTMISFLKSHKVNEKGSSTYHTNCKSRTTR